MPDNKNNTKPNFNAAAYKHAISMIESSGGKLLETGINPKTGKPYSSAAGRYHFLYNLIRKAPEMKGVTKRQFMNNPELQEKIMDLALDDKLKGFSYGPARANKLIKKHGSNMSTEQATALIHFIGIGAAETAIKDPKNFKVAGKNMTVDGYLNKFNVGVQRYKKHEDWMANNQTEVRVDGPDGDFTITKEGPVMGYDANGMAILRKDDTPPIAGDGTSYVSNYTPEQTAVREAVMDNEIQQAQVVQQQDRAQRAGRDAVAQPAVVQPGDRNIDNQQTIKAIAPGGHDINNQKNLQGLQLTGEKRTNQRDPYARVQTNEFEGGGGLFDNMELGFDGLDPGAGSAGAGAAPAAPGGPGVGAYVGAASTALELGQMAFGKNDMNTSGLVPPEDVPSKGSAALGGAMKGAAAGAAFGPWGAAIGGVVGAGAGLLGNKKAATAAREADINYTGNIHNQETNDYAMGGSIQGAPTEVSHDASDLVTLFENGGSHQQNSLGGIPQGVGSNGKQNLVEEGETKWNDYIFSNKINTDGSSSEDKGSSKEEFNMGGELGTLQNKISKRRLSKQKKASLIPRKLKNETMREFTIRKRRSSRDANTFEEGGSVKKPRPSKQRVKELQTLLFNEGLLTEEGVDGLWGPGTQEAYKSYEARTSDKSTSGVIPLQIKSLWNDITGDNPNSLDRNSLNEGELKALQDMVRTNLSQGKNKITYDDYKTERLSAADGTATGEESSMSTYDKLTDPYYKLKTTLGQAKIMVTPQNDTLVMDTYDFNNNDGTGNFDKLRKAIKENPSPYNVARQIGTNYGSQDKEGASVIINTNQEGPVQENNKFKEGGELDPPTEGEESPSTLDGMLGGIKDKLNHYSDPVNFARLMTMGPLLEGGLSFAKNQVAENLNPVGYGSNVSHKNSKNLSGESRLLKDVNSRHRGPASKLLDALAGNAQRRSANDKVESRANVPFVKERQDLLQMLMNDSSPKGGSISESQYKPSFAVSGQKYYSSPETEASIIRDLKKNPDLMNQFKDNGNGIKRHVGYGVNDSLSAEEQGNVLGNYTMTLQKDEDGREYIDYYDKWDLQPYKQNKGATKITDALQSMAGMEAPEIYGRIYLDQLNKKKNTNTTSKR